MKKKVIISILLLITATIILSSIALAAAPGTVVGDKGVILTSTPFISFSNSTDLSKYNLKHTFVNQNPDPVEPDQYVELRWKVENFGSKQTENVWVEIIPEYPFSLMPGDSSIQKIGSLNGRQIGDKGVIVYWKLKVDHNALEGNSEIKVRYSTDNGVSSVEPDPFLVRIRTPDAILGIESVHAKPQYIRPGEASLVSITLHNLADSPLRDIRAELDLSGTLLVPIGSSNEKTLTSMDRRSFKQLNFTLAAESDAKSQIVKIPVLFNYQDTIGTKYTRNATIGLPIGNIPDLSTNLETTDIHSRGNSGEISVKFVNKGVTDIKFLTVTLTPTNQLTLLSSSEVYVGNIDSDDYETAEFELYVEKTTASQITLPLRLEYKDANNKPYAEDAEVILKLYSQEDLKKLGLQKKSSPTLGIFITLIIVGGGIYLNRRIRKKRSKK